MRKASLATGFATLVLTGTIALAQSNTTVGVGVGAVTGAAVAGPVGAVVGGVAGGLEGSSTERPRRATHKRVSSRSKR